MYGKHLSEETRKKQSEAKKGKYEGGNNPTAKKVHCNGMIFPTITECAEFYNVKRRTMNTWLQGRCEMPSEFIKLGLRYATEEDIKKYPIYIEKIDNKINEIIEITKGKNSSKCKKVYCNEMIFKSKKQCAEFYNVKLDTMGKWLLGINKTPSEFIELGLRYATREDIEKYPPYIEEQNKQN